MNFLNKPEAWPSENERRLADALEAFDVLNDIWGDSPPIYLKRNLHATWAKMRAGEVNQPTLLSVQCQIAVDSGYSDYPYRIDFCITMQRSQCPNSVGVFVEADGQQHSGHAQRTKDYVRDRVALFPRIIPAANTSIAEQILDTLYGCNSERVLNVRGPIPTIRFNSERIFREPRNCAKDVYSLLQKLYNGEIVRHNSELDAERAWEMCKELHAAQNKYIPFSVSNN